jgi:hypothetical protein
MPQILSWEILINDQEKTDNKTVGLDPSEDALVI